MKLIKFHSFRGRLEYHLIYSQLVNYFASTLTRSNMITEYYVKSRVLSHIVSIKYLEY